MNINEIKELEERKKRLIEVLTTRNIQKFVFSATIDDLDEDDASSFYTLTHTKSTMESIGMAEYMKAELISKSTRE